jgi:hypothetical protein
MPPFNPGDQVTVPSGPEVLTVVPSKPGDPAGYVRVDVRAADPASPPYEGPDTGPHALYAEGDVTPSP